MWRRVADTLIGSGIRGWVWRNYDCFVIGSRRARRAKRSRHRNYVCMATYCQRPVAREALLVCTSGRPIIWLERKVCRLKHWQRRKRHAGRHVNVVRRICRCFVVVDERDIQNDAARVVGHVRIGARVSGANGSAIGSLAYFDRSAGIELAQREVLESCGDNR